MGAEHSTEFLDQMTDEYLAKLSKGELEPGDQLIASVFIDQRLTLLKNTVKALSPSTDGIRPGQAMTAAELA